jgi:hypothetical protein
VSKLERVTDLVLTCFAKATPAPNALDTIRDHAEALFHSLEVARLDSPDDPTVRAALLRAADLLDALAV